MKAALVLSGGGAKGAYQVGVYRALLELGVEVTAVSGASIGALNGALIAAAPSPHTALDRLQTVWEHLASASPLQARAPTYPVLLLAAGLHTTGWIGALASTLLPALGVRPGSTLEGILSDAPLRRMLVEWLDLDALAQGLPLHVSVYREEHWAVTLQGICKAELGWGDTKDSEFVHIQQLPRREQTEALLASAAIPVLFGAKTVQGRSYSDGGQGGWRTCQGNTPIQPLLDAGHQCVVVTHLSDASSWDRTAYPNATVIEVRPQREIARDKTVIGGTRDLLGFSPKALQSWMAQGHEDTMHCIGSVMKAARSVQGLSAASAALRQAESITAAGAERLRLALKKLDD